MKRSTYLRNWDITIRTRSCDRPVAQGLWDSVGQLQRLSNGYVAASPQAVLLEYHIAYWWISTRNRRSMKIVCHQNDLLIISDLCGNPRVTGDIVFGMEHAAKQLGSVVRWIPNQTLKGDGRLVACVNKAKTCWESSVNRDFLTWLVTIWQLRCQSIISSIRTFMLIDRKFNVSCFSKNISRQCASFQRRSMWFYGRELVAIQISIKKACNINVDSAQNLRYKC